MWIAAAGKILGSLGSSGAEKKKAKLDFQNSQKLNEQEGVIGRQNSAFDMELAYYYKNLDRQEKMRGLDEFRKFSTVTDFAPNYQSSGPAVLPVAKPGFNTGEYAPAKKY